MRDFKMHWWLRRETLAACRPTHRCFKTSQEIVSKSIHRLLGFNDVRAEPAIIHLSVRPNASPTACLVSITAATAVRECSHSDYSRLSLCEVWNLLLWTMLMFLINFILKKVNIFTKITSGVFLSFSTRLRTTDDQIAKKYPQFCAIAW